MGFPRQVFIYNHSPEFNMLTSRNTMFSYLQEINIYSNHNYIQVLFAMWRPKGPSDLVSGWQVNYWLPPRDPRFFGKCPGKAPCHFCHVITCLMFSDLVMSAALHDIYTAGKALIFLLWVHQGDRRCPTYVIWCRWIWP